MSKWLALIAVAALLVFVAGCSDDDECPSCPPDGTAPNLAYVGTQTCGTAGCHESIHTMFMQSGHPFKLTAVPGSQGPTYPWDDQHPNSVVANDGPPPGHTWDEFAYVIGGFGWKARWVQPDGKIFTADTTAQLNLWAGSPEWVDYHHGEDRPYNYNCFKCHTTGATDQGSWPSGTIGFGTFEFGGVQCEECHGQGSQHASDPARFHMQIDRSSALCGKCHTRDPQNRVLVSGGYIRHHEQFDELVHSPHSAIGCGGCHDPHASTVYDAVAAGSGVTATCESCHQDEAANIAHNGNPGCTDCHMPQAAKSARFDPQNPYIADIASHTFTINAGVIDADSTMWTSDGKFLSQDEFGRGHLTLDFACFSCHKDAATNPTNPGAPYGYKLPVNLIGMATGMHDAP
jgi:predicted CXXCH cytochrome family protein